MTHPDVRGCEDHFKTIHRAFGILKDETTREIYDHWSVEKVKNKLSRTTNWND